MTFVIRVIFVLLLVTAVWTVFCRLAAVEVARAYPTIEGLQEAIRWDPEGPDAYYQLGRMYRDNSEYQDLNLARHYLEKATELNPYNWRYYWSELAQTYDISQMPVEAEQAFLKTIELDPRHAIRRWQFANFYLRQGDLVKALEHFGKAIEFEPRHYLEPTLSLLWKSGVTGEDILSIWPEDKQARLRLLKFWVQQERIEEELLMEQWGELSESTDVPTVVEGEFYVRYLLDRERFEEAKEEWVRLNGVNGFEDMIWNGEFMLPLTGRLLGWVLRINSQIGQIEKEEGLRIEFAGQENVDFNGLSQLVIVEPGVEYDFSFKARSEDISTEQGLYFEVIGSSVLFQAQQILGTTEWTEYSGRLRIPQDQHLVTVQLRRRPSKRIDNKLRGTLWVEWVRLKRTKRLT